MYAGQSPSATRRTDGTVPGGRVLSSHGVTEDTEFGTENRVLSSHGVTEGTEFGTEDMYYKKELTKVKTRFRHCNTGVFFYLCKAKLLTRRILVEVTAYDSYDNKSEPLTAFFRLNSH